MDWPLTLVQTAIRYMRVMNISGGERKWEIGSGNEGVRVRGLNEGFKSPPWFLQYEGNHFKVEQYWE